jgi:DNA repair protein REV1
MKVVRPEWLVESANAGVLLQWQDFISVPDSRLEIEQGAKVKQTSLLDKVRPPKAKASCTTNEAPARPTSSRLEAIQEALDEHKITPKDMPKEIPKYASHTSNPIAERAMANPEWRKAHTSVAPDFIEGYYKNSRLHHLSTWKAELKSLVQEAQERAEAGDGSGESLVGKVQCETVTGGDGGGGVRMKGAELVMKSPSKGTGKGKEKAVDDRVIMHCDFDCFFVSAGLVSRPQLKGKPVVVCHSQGSQGGLSSTSEIASASYEARSFGIKNGMRYVLVTSVSLSRSWLLS